jgi:hypothetical protein
MVLLLELTFSMKTLGKMFRFAMWSWARLAGAAEQNSGEVRRDLAGEGWGKGLGTTSGRFGVLGRAVVAPASSSPAAREGRPRRSLFRRGCGLGKERDAREAIVDARGGGGRLCWACGRPEPGARRGSL